MTFRDITPASLAVRQSGSWLVVDVWGHHCAACKGLEQQLALMKTSLPDHCDLVRLSADDFADWCAEQGIRSVPALLLYSEGTEVARLQGDLSVNSIRAFLSHYLPAPPDPETLCSELFMSARTDELRTLLDSLTDEQSRGPALQRARSWLSMQEMTLTQEESELRNDFFVEACAARWNDALALLTAAMKEPSQRHLIIALADLIPDRPLVSQWRRRYLLNVSPVE